MHRSPNGHTARQPEIVRLSQPVLGGVVLGLTPAYLLRLNP